MKTAAEHRREEIDDRLGEAPDAPPKELLPLLVEEGDIPFPDTPEWRSLGATARWQFALRQKSPRSLRIVRFLATAAVFVVIASVAALRLRPISAESCPECVHAWGPVVQPVDTISPDTDRQTTQDSIAGVLADIHALANQFELDYVALELVRSGTLQRDETHCVDQVLESYEIDAIEVFLASRAVL